MIPASSYVELVQLSERALESWRLRVQVCVSCQTKGSPVRRVEDGMACLGYCLQEASVTYTDVALACTSDLFGMGRPLRLGGRCRAEGMASHIISSLLKRLCSSGATVDLGQLASSCDLYSHH